MGISIVRFGQTDQASQWGIIEHDKIAVLAQHFASHREIMDAWFSNPAALKLDGLPRIGLAETNQNESLRFFLVQRSSDLTRPVVAR